MKAVSRLDPILGEYRWRARRQLRAQGILEPTTSQVLAQADSLRWDDFRRHVEPLERRRAALVTQYLSYQTDALLVTVHEQTVGIRVKPLPEWLQASLEHWDGLIEIEARRFGYGGIDTD